MTLFNNVHLNMPLAVYIQVSHRNNKPCLELRRNLCDYDLMKVLISCALNEHPVIIMPMFSNKLQGLSSLLEKGILYFNKEENKYNFTF